MPRDGPPPQTRCRSPSGTKGLDGLKRIQTFRGNVTRLSNLETAVLTLFDSVNNWFRWKTLNEKAKFIIRILVIVLIVTLIYQLIRNPQLAEELLKEIIRITIK